MHTLGLGLGLGLGYLCWNYGYSIWVCFRVKGICVRVRVIAFGLELGLGHCVRFRAFALGLAMIKSI